MFSVQLHVVNLTSYTIVCDTNKVQSQPLYCVIFSLSGDVCLVLLPDMHELIDVHVFFFPQMATGANTAPLGKLHPILAAKFSEKPNNNNGTR